MSHRDTQGRTPRAKALKKAAPRGRRSPKKTEQPKTVERVVRPNRSWSASRKTDMVVILDLDQTLVYSEAFGPSSVERRYVFDVGGTTVKGSTRPNLKPFLEYLEQYAKEVIVWTAGTADYANLVVSVTHESLKQPRVLSRDDCVWNDEGGYLHKPIVRIADLLDCDPSSILIIDDKAYTFQENPKNGLLIPPYEGSDHDDALGQIVDWLEKPEVRHSWSTTQLNKDGIFAQ